MLEFGLTVINTCAAIITALGVIIGASKHGRKWLLKPLDNKLSAHIANINKTVDHLGKKLSNQQREGRRIEILMLLRDYPNNVEAIEGAFSYYKKLGGNTYIDRLVEKWRVGQHKDISGASK